MGKLTTETIYNSNLFQYLFYLENIDTSKRYLVLLNFTAFDFFDEAELFSTF